eukprot:gnl/TRDRNA2_/TRDRNA2_84041_c0_seq1.p1 gnl/TRDRNA2_/TRDRNA2_84041_c0~~gnl/TRDRNA2_/TRDRNA2_84041_c0_seq1.p1  ORF type:complete len:118 (+),score=28.48 gnl/TRDRNA2_/TRDRNA2_84041_c0_seq1:97-450(+)
MAIRFATMRRFASKPVPLGLEGSPMTTVKNTLAEAKGFSFSSFFEEKNFWSKANVGPFFLLLLFTPSIYRSIKDFYWTRQLRKLNTEEIISDRYEWLRISMLKDEVEAVLLTQAPAE